MIEPTDIIYAQRLRSLRLSRDIKQHILCEKIGLNSQQEYSKLENGKSHFTDELIQNISSAFEISIEEFTMPQGNANITNSPHATSNYISPNTIVNDISLIEQVLKSKDELISSQKQHINMLEEIIRQAKKS